MGWIQDGEFFNDTLMAGFTFVNIDVVEVGYEPISGGVAAVAGAFKMAGIETVFRQGEVAGVAFCRCIGIFADGMAGQTIQLNMSTG